MILNAEYAISATIEMGARTDTGCHVRAYKINVVACTITNATNTHRFVFALTLIRPPRRKVYTLSL